MVYITRNVAEAVFLGDKVIVMAAHPGTIRQEVRILLSRPRDPLSDEFIALQRHLLAVLGERKHGGRAARRRIGRKPEQAAKTAAKAETA